MSELQREELQEFHFTISEETDGLRIDKCVNLLSNALSRSYIQKLLSDGNITVSESQLPGESR